MDEAVNPFDALTELRRRLFHVLDASLPEAGQRAASFSPPVDIVAAADRIVITVELPGMTRDEVEVAMEGNTLTISGERRPDLDEGEETVYRRERVHGRFSRSLALPPGGGKGVAASLRDGVLTVTVGKASEGQENA